MVRLDPFALLAKTLGVSADELLGIQKPKPVRKTRDTRLWRRFSQIEKMGQQERRRVMQVLDAFIEWEQLKKKSRPRIDLDCLQESVL